MTNIDFPLFLALNFDGGPCMDTAMRAVSGTWMWLPLYVGMLWLVWRKFGWRGLWLFLAAMALALGLSDMVCGIFKHNGVVGSWFHPFEPRLRPIHTPELQGLIHQAAGGGRYGTVSGHAATITSVVTLGAWAIRRWWFTLVAVLWAGSICYSRLYLGLHFPLDILWGILTGLIVGSGVYVLWRKIVNFAKK